MNLEMKSNCINFCPLCEYSNRVLRDIICGVFHFLPALGSNLPENESPIVYSRTHTRTILIICVDTRR